MLLSWAGPKFQSVSVRRPTWRAEKHCVRAAKARQSRAAAAARRGSKIISRQNSKATMTTKKARQSAQ